MEQAAATQRSKSSTSGASLYRSAKSLLQSGQPAEALQAFQRIEHEDPGFLAGQRFADFFNDWAHVLRVSGNYDAAIQKYRQALQVEPDNGHALHHMAEVYEQIGKSDEARRFYSEADAAFRSYIRRDPSGGPYASGVYRNWAQTLVALRDYSGAQEKYEKAAEVDSGLLKDESFVAEQQTLAKLMNSASSAADYGSIAEEPARAQAEESPSPRRLLRLDIAARAMAERAGPDLDLLGFKDYADALADLIRNERTEKPLTIGIEAPWGMGKTHLMRMVQERLFRQDGPDAKKVKMPTVWFDAWKYDKEESLWAALALAVLTQARCQITHWQWMKTWLRLNWQRRDRNVIARSAMNFGLYAAAVLLLLVPTFLILQLFPRLQEDALNYVGTAGLVAAAVALFKALYVVHGRLAIPFDEKIARYVRQPKYDERVGFLARFQEDFKEIVKVITGTAANPLVIFIDDLDRCTPTKAVEVLEAINLLLDSDRCVFVIGMDAKAVVASIEAKYKDVVAQMKGLEDPGGLTLGQRFLEKILQIEFRVPPPSPEHMLAYVDGTLGAKESGADDIAATQAQVREVKQAIAQEEEQGKTLSEAAQTEKLAHVPQNVKVQAKVEHFAEFFDSYDVVRTAIQAAAQSLDNNPRKVKRFVNAFRLQAMIANRRKLLEEDIIDLSLLAKWLIAETRWPELMSDVIDEPEILTRAVYARGLYAKYDELPDADTRARLEAATQDSKVKRLAQAHTAAEFIGELQKHAGASLNAYLHLGRIAGSIKPGSSAANMN